MSRAVSRKRCDRSSASASFGDLHANVREQAPRGGLRGDVSVGELREERRHSPFAVMLELVVQDHFGCLEHAPLADGLATLLEFSGTRQVFAMDVDGTRELRD